MNKVILIGRLTADPESKISANGVNRVTFNIAVNDVYNSKKRTTFIPCVAWNNQANFIQSYLKKGNLEDKENNEKKNNKKHNKK